uniref:(northern house mosquito) hypothetical protein n=1 Tax=Culex pipiens TaxID=7175 RepID=A0A8D8CEG2_CULPI
MCYKGQNPQLLNHREVRTKRCFLMLIFNVKSNLQSKRTLQKFLHVSFQFFDFIKKCSFPKKLSNKHFYGGCQPNLQSLRNACSKLAQNTKQRLKNLDKNKKKDKSEQIFLVNCFAIEPQDVASFNTFSAYICDIFFVISTTGEMQNAAKT